MNRTELYKSNQIIRFIHNLEADAQGVCAALDVKWLHPVISKAAVQEAFEVYGAVKYVQMCLGNGWAGVPKTTGRLVHTYNYA